jgi:hypothetical protein
MSLNYCTNCGKKRNPNEKFCGQCGEQLEENIQMKQGLPTNTNIAPKNVNKFNAKKAAFILIPIVLLVVVYMYIFDWNNPHKSKVKGVSDKVYYQLVEQYFYNKTLMDIYEDRKEVDSITEWMKSLDQFEEAEKFAERNDRVYSPFEVFPNPLIFDYFTNEEFYTDKEVELIEKIMDVTLAMQRFKKEEYSSLMKELKTELRIKESYNMFDK